MRWESSFILIKSNQHAQQIFSFGNCIIKLCIKTGLSPPPPHRQMASRSLIILPFLILPLSLQSLASNPKPISLIIYGGEKISPMIGKIEENGEVQWYEQKIECGESRKHSGIMQKLHNNRAALSVSEGLQNTFFLLQSQKTKCNQKRKDDLKWLYLCYRCTTCLTQQSQYNPFLELR